MLISILTGVSILTAVSILTVVYPKVVLTVAFVLTVVYMLTVVSSLSDSSQQHSPHFNFSCLLYNFSSLSILLYEYKFYAYVNMLV